MANSNQQKKDRVKQGALLFFVSICAVLVILTVWLAFTGEDASATSAGGYGVNVLPTEAPLSTNVPTLSPDAGPTATRIGLTRSE